LQERYDKIVDSWYAKMEGTGEHFDHIANEEDDDDLKGEMERRSAATPDRPSYREGKTHTPGGNVVPSPPTPSEYEFSSPPSSPTQQTKRRRDAKQGSLKHGVP
jgi:hypothetical protein